LALHGQGRVRKKLIKCEDQLRRVLASKKRKYEKKFTCYETYSKDFRKWKILKETASHNDSLRLFIDALDAQVIPEGLPE